MSAVALLSTDPALERRLRGVLGLTGTGDLRRWREEYGRIDPTKVAAELADDGAEVVCLGPELPDHLALALARAFDLDHPAISVVMLCEPTAALWHGSLRAGVRGLLSPRAGDDELRSVVREAVEAAARRRVTVVPPSQPTRRPQVIVVLSPKGGSGKTVVAVNLAAALARSHPNEVALVDLDVQFGDVNSALYLNPEHTMVDVVRSAASLDATSLKVFLTAHASGLWVLASPESPADADDVTPRHAAEALRLLATEFPFVVVDTPAGLDERTLAAVEQASDLVLVPTMDVSSVRALRKELDVLDSLGIHGPRRHLVLNRADARVGLQVRDVEAALGASVDLALPSSRAVPVAFNQGQPLSQSDPRAPITRQLDELASRFTDRPTPPTEGSWLRRRKETR